MPFNRLRRSRPALQRKGRRGPSARYRVNPHEFADGFTNILVLAPQTVDPAHHEGVSASQHVEQSLALGPLERAAARLGRARRITQQIAEIAYEARAIAEPKAGEELPPPYAGEPWLCILAAASAPRREASGGRLLPGVGRAGGAHRQGSQALQAQ